MQQCNALCARLKHTWNGVREQEETDYSRLAQEYSNTNNYSELRAIHSSAPPPIVPFLGMYVPLNSSLLHPALAPPTYFNIFQHIFYNFCRYLSDITFIDEGNPNSVQVRCSCPTIPFAHSFCRG